MTADGDAFSRRLSSLSGIDFNAKRLYRSGLPSEMAGQQFFDRLSATVFDHPERLSDVTTLCRRRLKESPADPLAHSALAWACYCQRRFHSAEKELYKALMALPSRLDLWIVLGQTLRHLASPLGEDVLFDLPLFAHAAIKNRGRVDRQFLDMVARDLERRRVSLSWSWKKHVPAAIRDAAI